MATITHCLCTMPEQLHHQIRRRTPERPVPTPEEHDALAAHELLDLLRRYDEVIGWLCSSVPRDVQAYLKDAQPWLGR